MKKILLTGSNGFIGSNLFHQLKEHTSVTCIDYSSGSTEQDFTNLNLTDINQVNDFADKYGHFDIPHHL